MFRRVATLTARAASGRVLPAVPARFTTTAPPPTPYLSPTARPAPQFSATAVNADGTFVDVKLSDYTGKYTVLLFYPLDFTFVCPTEITAFSDAADQFAKRNANVLAISVDSHYSHLAWRERPRSEGGLGELQIPLVSDLGGKIAQAYGVYLPEAGVALRGLFVIDGKGKVRASVVHDLPVGRSVDETLRLIDAFQFTDEHGEVCPAGWSPGKATMKPHPEGSKEYFQKAH
eukprot:TRINITY_DN72503_c0_g1_i1.p2 TRINITY_DN72503_c0_g1~~TRINITY_DN72503_c0_g1_i1.p2  ORF type:complete len:231 (+),score=39.48 TRINITY_DN72503_c0_g1_i1:185-877(+)